MSETPERHAILRAPRRRLPRGARWTVRLIYLLPLLTLLISTIFYGIALTHLLRASLPAIVSRQATLFAKHEVRIGAIDFSAGTVTLRNIDASRGTTFAQYPGQSAFRSPRVTIHYSVARFLSSNSVSYALGDINVQHPYILVERFDNKHFNFSPLINIKAPKKQPFEGRVLVQDATVQFRDYQAPLRLTALQRRPALNTLVHGNATVDFHSEQLISFSGEAQGVAGRFRVASATGSASRTVKGRFTVTINATDAPAAYWFNYFVKLPQAYVTAGRADIQLTLSQLRYIPPPHMQLDMFGHVALRDGTVAITDKRISRLPVRHINGSADFTENDVTLHGNLTLADQPFIADGSVFNFKHPRFAVTAVSSHIDLQQLVRAIPALRLPPGLFIAPAAGTLQFVGPANDTAIRVAAISPRATFQGNQATDLRMQALFSRQVFSIPSLTFRVAKTGTATVRATLTSGQVGPDGTKIGTLLAAGKVHNVDLAALNLPAALMQKVHSVGGKADISFLAGDHGHPLAVAANFIIHQPRVQQTTLRVAQGRLAWLPGHALVLNQALIQDTKGTALVSGSVPIAGPSAHWGLTVEASNLDLYRLLHPYVKAPVSGIAAFRGTIGGLANAPVAMGDTQVFQPHYGLYALDAVRGHLQASQTSLWLSRVVLQHFPTEVRLSGNVTQLASQDPALNLNLNFSQADIQDFLGLANQASPKRPPVRSLLTPKAARTVEAALPTLTGTAAGNFHVAGHVHTPSVKGVLSVTDATVGAYRVTQARADLAYQTTGLHVTNGVVRLGDATITGSGVWQPKTDHIQGQFSGNDLNLIQFGTYTRPYADVAGIVDFSGAITGTTRAPDVALVASAQDLSIDGQKIAPFSGVGRYNDGVITQTGDPWTLTLEAPVLGALDPQTPIKYTVDNLKLSLPTPNHPTRHPSLALTAHIPEDAPERIPHLVATLSQGRIGQTDWAKQALAEIARLPQPVEGTVAIPSFHAQGYLDHLALLASVHGTGLGAGTNHIQEAHITGSGILGTDPSGQVKADATGLLIANIPVTKLTLDSDYAQHTLKVNRLQATNDRAYLSAKGTADLRTGGHIQADLDASNVPLQVFNPLLRLQPAPRDPLVTTRPVSSLTGEIGTLTVNASGLTSAPDLVASVNLVNPALTVTTASQALALATGKDAPAVETSTYALDSIRSGAITLNSPQPGSAKVLTVTDLTAFKNGNPVATASGSVPVHWGDSQNPLPTVSGDQPFHADLQIQDLAALAVLMPGLDPKKTSGTLTAHLNAVGTASTNQISGDVILTNASIGLLGAQTLETGVTRQYPFYTTLNHINGHILVANGQAVVQAFHGQSSSGGSFDVTGQANLDQQAALDLRLALNSLAVDETPKESYLSQVYQENFHGVVQGDVAIKGPLTAPTLTNVSTAPLIVTQATGSIPVPPQNQLVSTQTPKFDLKFNNLQVALGTTRKGTAVKTVGLRTPLLRADATGSLTLKGSLAAPQLTARLDIIRGQLLLPPSLLKIVPPLGSVILTYPVASIDSNDSKTEEQPTLRTEVQDLTAQTTVYVTPSALAASSSVTGNEVSAEPVPGATVARYPTYSGLGDRPQRYAITLEVNGVLDPNHPDKLTIIPSSSPGDLTNGQIFAALGQSGAFNGILSGGNGAQTAISNEIAAAFNNLAVPALLSPFENGVADTFGLSSFNVDYVPDNPLLVTLTKQLTDRLNATYTRYFGARTTGTVNSTVGPTQYSLSLGYDLTKRLQLSISTDDQRNNTVSVNGLFRF